MTHIRTRFAPSPTGSLHIGGVRTALYAWAFARKNKGTFVLRIEDTDTTRSTIQSENTILDGLAWLGIDWDVGPIKQMDRLERYKEVVESLIESGHAYRCYDESKTATTDYKNTTPYRSEYRESNVKLDKPYVIRMHVPENKIINYHDELKGNMTLNSNMIEDWILVRQNGIPTYNFAVVVDDMDMNITHVIRGDDHINNTPKQVLLYNVLNAKLPKFVHLPLILDVNGKKISKRDIPLPNSVPTTLAGMQADGILPQALLNYMARLGWAHGDDEFFTLDQFVDWFSIEGLSNSPAKVDGKKLNWLNAQHLKVLNPLEFKAWASVQLKGNETATFSDRLPCVQSMLNKRGNETATFRQDIDVLNEITKTSFTTYALEPVVFKAWTKLAEEWSVLSKNIDTLETGLKNIADQTQTPFKEFAISLRNRMTDAAKTPSLSAMLLIMPPDYVQSWLNGHIYDLACEPHNM